jgi:hypothetical protein
MATLLEVWKKRNKILEGIKNSVFTNEHIEELAASRNAICQECEFIDREGVKCFMPGTQPCCGVCGCSLKFLQRSPSSECEKEKWLSVMSEDEEIELLNKLENDGNNISTD